MIYFFPIEEESYLDDVAPPCLTAMTIAADAAIHTDVRRLCMLLLWMIASSLVVTTAVHAREWTGAATTLECSGTVHSESDSDQSPGDIDKGVPHHHGSCHGQAAAVPPGASIGYLFASASSFAGDPARSLRPRSVDPALRPPTA